jgi:c-di-GMP-binding flagellar brake protein YcgR
MRSVILPQHSEANEGTLSLSSGPGAPIFQHGTQTRIYRAPVRAIASVRFGEKEVFGQVVDISLGGCLLKTETTIEEGTEVELRITILGEMRRAVAEVQGVVRRATTVEGRKAYGVELVANDPEEKRSLEWLYTQALR